MSKLSNADSRTIRLAREAIALVIDGAIRRLETQYGPNDEANRSFAIDALLLHCREEAAEIPTQHELGEMEAEHSGDDTALVD